MEVWKPIDGWPWYEVSDQGRVRSVNRVITFSDGRVRPYKGQVLAACSGSHGYPMVKLCAENSVHEMVCVHHLVARTFLGPKPSAKHEIRHLNDVRRDCRLCNLVYGTSTQNKIDIKTNRPDSALYTLTLDQVREIKRAQKMPYFGQGRELARKYGVGDSQISNIKYGRSHSEIVV